MNASAYSQLTKTAAAEEGFMFCGISAARKLEEQAIFLERWLKNGQHASMQWMERWFDLRTDPSRLVPGAKTVVSLAYNYFPEHEPEGESYKISRYAYGEDYHRVIRKKLKALLKKISDGIGEVYGRGFVDSGPVMEKVWAAQSGIGWQGKNTNIIHPKRGSYFFLAELILDVEMQADGPLRDYCGTCTACQDACPTGALDTAYRIDSSRCISYLTIEHRGELPQWARNKMEGWIFGCDICQEVCPWNRFSIAHQEERFSPLEELKNFGADELEALSREQFEIIFKNSPLKRTGFDGWQRNIRFIRTSLQNDKPQ